MCLCRCTQNAIKLVQLFNCYTKGLIIAEMIKWAVYIQYKAQEEWYLTIFYTIYFLIFFEEW